jgi:hypothetical protein
MSFDDHKLAPMFGAFKRHGRFQLFNGLSENTRISFSDHSNRSIRLKNFVSRIVTQRPDVVRIALTAVAGGAAFPVARWIEGRRDAEAVGRVDK